MFLTADACTPIPAAAAASRTNSTHPPGWAPVTSHPAANPPSSASSASSAQVTCPGHAPARPCSAGTSSAPRAPAALEPTAMRLPAATPATYPAMATAV
jgi:hypothetical protein